MKEYCVEFYQAEGGKQPAKEFISELDHHTRAKIMAMIVMLQKNGPEMREPYSKHLDDGLFELRASAGSLSIRMIFFYGDDGKIILTNGFLKKTRKTPLKELRRAKEYKADYYSRKGDDHEQ